MKTSAISLILVLASAIAHGAQFEGRLLIQRAEPPESGHQIIYSIKGDKVRVEVIRDRVTSYPSLAPSSDAPKLEKTDETTKIHGYTAQKYLLTSDEGKTELWLAEGFGKYTGFGEGFEKPPIQEANVDVPDPVVPWAWEWALAGQPLFPLRVITRDSNGSEIFRLEVKEIHPQPLSDGLFRPSSNYKKLDSWPEK
jgi:hypothetical protein